MTNDFNDHLPRSLVFLACGGFKDNRDNRDNLFSLLALLACGGFKDNRDNRDNLFFLLALLACGGFNDNRDNRDNLWFVWLSAFSIFFSLFISMFFSLSGACSAAHSFSNQKFAIKKIVSIVSIVFKPSQGSLVFKVLARALVVQSPKKEALLFKGSRPGPCRLAKRLTAHGRVARLGLFAASAVGSVALQLVHTLDGGIELKA